MSTDRLRMAVCEYGDKHYPGWPWSADERFAYFKSPCSGMTATVPMHNILAAYDEDGGQASWAGCHRLEVYVQNPIYDALERYCTKEKVTKDEAVGSVLQEMLSRKRYL